MKKINKIIQNEINTREIIEGDIDRRKQGKMESKVVRKEMKDENPEDDCF